jgi:hypothetical protein
VSISCHLQDGYQFVYQMPRRYSLFFDLYELIQKQFHFSYQHFPRKMPMANKKSNVIEERRIQLESFLNELAKSKEIVHSEALQNFLELPNAIDRELSNNRSRGAGEIIEALIDSEKKYISQLEILKVFKRRLREALNRTEALNRSDLDPLFNNIEAIYLYHDQFFQDIQKNSRNRPKTLSLVKPVEAMLTFNARLYTDYINNFETTKELISIFKSHTVLTQAILDCEFELREQNVKLEDLIFAPAQQIKQYYHMLQQLSSLPEEVVENIEDLDVTLKTVKELYVNMQKILKAQHTLHDDWMRVDELLGNELNEYEVPHGARLWREGEMMFSQKLKSHSKEKSFYVYLFDNRLLITVRDQKHHGQTKVKHNILVKKDDLIELLKEGHSVIRVTQFKESVFLRSVDGDQDTEIWMTRIVAAAKSCP